MNKVLSPNADFSTLPEKEGVEEHLQQYLSFSLKGEHYGVDILRVQEIKGWAAVTKVPNSPDYLLGVLNLRGAIIPVVDLRLRFGLESLAPGPTTVVVVLRVVSGEARRTMGMMVDGVSDVFDVSGMRIQPPPDFGTDVGTEFINGITTVGGSTVMLLDVDRLLAGEEDDPQGGEQE